MKFEISEQWGIRYRALMKRFRDQHGDLTAQSLIAIGEAIFNAVDRQGPQVKDVSLLSVRPLKKQVVVNKSKYQ